MIFTGRTSRIVTHTPTYLASGNAVCAAVQPFSQTPETQGLESKDAVSNCVVLSVRTDALFILQTYVFYPPPGVTVKGKEKKKKKSSQ